jgi:hypothetical protein
MLITVRNIGPVKTAGIDLKPLVVFTGPDGAGGSLLAEVLYVELGPGRMITDKIKERNASARPAIFTQHPAVLAKVRLAAGIGKREEHPDRRERLRRFISVMRAHAVPVQGGFSFSESWSAQAPRRSWYLPAVRVAYASSGSADVAGLNAVIADFVGGLLELDHGESGPFADEADRLESEVLRVAGTSSLAPELAPVVLYLRHLVQPDDHLFIEEPEANLRPGAQVALAGCVVRLVNRGLRVLLTTHSELFLQQLSNAVMAGSRPAGDASQEGANPEALDASQVAVYSFDPSDAGTTVTELAIDPKEGIAEVSRGDA